MPFVKRYMIIGLCYTACSEGARERAPRRRRAQAAIPYSLIL